MRVQISKNVDPTTLASQLSAALGISVSVSVRNPGQTDNSGNSLPGVVVLLDAKTGQELPDQDATKVANVISAHVVPTPPPSPAAALKTALGSAATVADLKTALIAFADAAAAQGR